MNVILNHEFKYVPDEGKKQRIIPEGSKGKVIRTVEELQCYHVRFKDEPVPFVEVNFSAVQPV